LESLKYTLGVGNIFYNSRDKTYKFKVSKFHELNDKILPHFEKYYLISQKCIDFELFSKIITIIKTKKHLTKQGLQQIINLKALLNLGLSVDLKKYFPDTLLLPRPKYKVKLIPNSQ
jgi:hypothetical protein